MLFDHRPRLRRCLACLSMVAAVGFPSPDAFAQINLPELGDADTEALSPAMERRIGERAVLDMRRSGEIDDDQETADYLNMLGGELAAASSVSAHEAGVAEPGFHFYMLESPVINAFATPGGVVAVHSGLLLETQTESELASVLGHEITHVTQRHGARVSAKVRP